VELDAGAGQDVLCARCGDALGMESARFAAAMGVTECTMCRMAPPPFTKAIAFSNYDNEMREMLQLLKFAGKRQMAEHVLGERLALTVLRLGALAAAELLVIPVPMFATRRRERGFNQAELLASAAIKRLKKSAPGWKLTQRDDLLERVKNTRALYTLNPAQRRRSLVGAFQVCERAALELRGCEVLLVDDIMTTGATARACAGVLLRAGAAKVWVATVARAQPEGVQTAVQTEPYEVALWSAPARTRVVEPDVGKQVEF
jgi:ComF family protein